MVAGTTRLSASSVSKSNSGKRPDTKLWPDTAHTSRSGRMTDHQRVIANMRARIGAILGLRAAVPILSAWLLVWGTSRACVARGAACSRGAAAVGTGGRGCGGRRRRRRCHSPPSFGRYRSCDARRPLAMRRPVDGGRRRGYWRLADPDAGFGPAERALARRAAMRNSAVLHGLSVGQLSHAGAVLGRTGLASVAGRR